MDRGDKAKQAAGKGVASSDLAVVETSNGKIRGASENGAYAFRGVRYADTTAGMNCFLPPQPVRKWAGVEDALRAGHSAPQVFVAESLDPFLSWYNAIEPTDEDCLFLNVFTPGFDAGKRPVMVWLHGGGWKELAGTAPGFDGTRLARDQDVVVVTLNHRLNAFGYILLEGSDDRFKESGHAGLSDIVMALVWVRDNAAAFGGDASNVTLFGELGGASKIAAVLAMRAAKGLFHKAILQSSARGLRLADHDEAARVAFDLARVLGRSRVDGADLQALPMEALVRALPSVPGAFRGVFDPEVFETDAFDVVAPPQSSGIPMMAGFTNTETTYHLRRDPRNFSLANSEVERRLCRFLGIGRDRVRAMIDHYREGYPGSRPSDILVMLTSDFLFKRNTLKIASLQAATAHAPVYVYLFDRDTPVEGGRLRSPHTCEVPFIFGTTAAAAAHVGGGSDIEPMTQRMMATWAAFARSGDPNNSSIPRWMPFTPSERNTMVLRGESRLQNDPGGEARMGLDGLPYFGHTHAVQALVSD